MRKGISPLIAAVLLIAFTMTVAGILAAWAIGFTRGKVGPRMAKKEKCLKMSASIRRVRYADKELKVLVDNRGETDIKGFKIVIRKTEKFGWENVSATTLKGEKIANFTLSPGSLPQVFNSSLNETPAEIMLYGDIEPLVEGKFVCSKAKAELDHCKWAECPH